MKLKKITALLIVVLMLFSLGGIGAVALEDEGVMPLAYSACPYGNGICDAKSAGWATLYYGSIWNKPTLLFQNGCAWQCTRCHTVYATQRDPLLGRNIGIFSSAGNIEDTGAYVHFMYVNSYSVVNSTKIEGINFRNA